MFSRVWLFLIRATYIYYQVLAAEEVFIGDLVAESNFTLTQQQLSFSNIDVHVNSSTGGFTVTILQTELVSECISIGDNFSCNCSGGYSWSHEVCNSFGCCSNAACTKNVSHITPLCIPKVQVYLNGSVTLNVTWDEPKKAELETAFRSNVNGVESLKITVNSNRTDFEAVISVKLNISVLQQLVTTLEERLSAKVWIYTVGLVTITSPEDIVGYQSNVELTCTLEEATTRSAWHLIKNNERLQLSSGSAVALTKCSTVECKSCVKVNINGVTGEWSGTYECGLTNGSVTHTAKAQLSVALLPEVINIQIDPPIVECSVNSGVKVTATILRSTESYDVLWEHAKRRTISQESFTTSEDNLVYSVKFNVSCQKMTKAQSVLVTFKNSKGQIKTEEVDIPVIYRDSLFCSGEKNQDVLWPKTPHGSTVIKKTCGAGKIGNKSRTCEGNKWKSVISNCISQELKEVKSKAEMFEKGLEATPQMALDIFEGLKNTTSGSDSSDNIAEFSASVNVLNVMAKASENTILTEPVLSNFLEAASNMLNGQSLQGSKSSIVQNLSSEYLKSVEGLVKNIRVNNSSNISNSNLDFKVCSGAECNISVFNISVTLNHTSKLKTVAVKKLVDKLSNSIDQTVLPQESILIIATLENSSTSPINITMEFPYQHLNRIPVCVFWNHKEWSKEGCKFEPGDGNHTICKCNHLTAFSVLMSKTHTSNPVLDIITYVGMGVSICSLLILLIIESLVWSAVVKTNLSHFRHTALVNIATFLLLGDCSFLASVSPENLSEEWCLILTICKHLFFLAMFGWMLCMSIMLVHQLIFVFSPLRKRVFMFFSSIIGYACPILIVAISFLYCKYTNKDYHDKKCWLVYERVLEGSIHAFILPVGTIIFTNLFSMMVVILTLMKSSIPDGSKADEKETAKSIIKVMVFLTPVFGVTWGISFFQMMLTEGQLGHTVALYSFNILNAFQGFFVMLTGCFAETKVREELLKQMFKRKHDSLKNSTTLTKDK